MTLLAVTYDGVRRMVEPYSLSYKRRKDGHAEEYFFCYDRTGGRSSPPGIKTFVSSKVQQIERLDEKFEPRFPVELSLNLASTAKRHISGHRFLREGRTWPRAVISTQAARCMSFKMYYCGKRFRRTKPDTRLNKHKDKYKNALLQPLQIRGILTRRRNDEPTIPQFHRRRPMQRPIHPNQSAP